jgi:endonuclease YncB( thermonuclease family)
VDLPRYGLPRFALVLAGLLGAIGIATPADVKSGDAGQDVSVVDADTLLVDGKIVQLFGIDAPELGQLCLHDGVTFHCGILAAFELHKLLDLQIEPPRCKPMDAVNPNGLFVCIAGHSDLAATLLHAGYVLAVPGANPDYTEAQESAKEANYGLWHSRFITPQAWRAGERLPEELAAALPCPVKGVADNNGTGRYFVPTDESYEALEIDPARGDRRFCTDEEARRAGWRRPGETISSEPTVGGSEGG